MWEYSESLDRALIVLKETNASGSKELVLSDMGLGDQDLAILIPKLKQDIPDIAKINLSGNALTTLPDGFKELTHLTNLVLNRNRYQEMPQVLRQMPSLRELHMGHNQMAMLPYWVGELVHLVKLSVNGNALKTLPSSFEQLTKLEEVYAARNQLAELPESLGRLRQLRKCYFTDNPLTWDTMRWLNVNFGDRVVTNLNAFDGGVNHETILKEVYGSDHQAIADLIDSVNLGDFEVGEGTLATKMPSKDLIIAFLKKVPVVGSHFEQVYRTAVMHLMAKALDPEYAIAERKNTLQEMAVALGDCATPVKSFLQQTFVGEYPRIGAGNSKALDGLITAMAVEDHIVKTLSKELGENEKIEQVQGLVNSLFLENAETMVANKLKIIGERQRLEGAAAYPNFAFELVTDALASKFAAQVCTTNEQGLPIQDQEGFYTLAPEKLLAITEAFNGSLGQINKRQAYINACGTHIENALKEKGLTDLDDPTTAESLLDIPRQQDLLRTQLMQTGEDQIEQVFQEFIARIDREIRSLNATHRSVQAAALEGPKNMGKMLAPMNREKANRAVKREPPSPKDGGTTLKKPRL